MSAETTPVAVAEAPVSAKRGPGARAVAVDMMRYAIESGAPLDEAESDAFYDLEPRDRGFVRVLTLTALRHLGQIDAVIKHFVPKTPPEPARSALRIATAELLFVEGASAYAAVDGAVSATRALPDGEKLAGLVNAVARRIAEQGAAIAAEQDIDEANTPFWLWKKLVRGYGEEAARAAAAAHRAGAPLDLTVKSDPAGWAARLGGAVTPTGSVRLPPSGAVDRLEGFEDGEWWAQDAAAALPVRLLGEVAGKKVLDMCAAPGGKTMQLAHAGAIVTAVDHNSGRLRRLRENLRRTGLEAETVLADGATWRAQGRFDAVLLDAPCSATGTIRRHPELPWRRDASAIRELTLIQDALLDRAWGMTRPGGVMVYAVCSLLREESEQRRTAFQARFPDAVPDPVKPEDLAGAGGDLESCGVLIRNGALRALPGLWAETGSLDGFYAMRWRKETAA